MLTDNEVEYDKVNLNIERFDLGEPIMRKEEYENEDQEQITPDVINPDGSIEVATSSNDDTTDRQYDFEVLDEVASSIEDLTSDDINKAIIKTSENHAVSDDVIQDDYDFDVEFRDF